MNTQNTSFFSKVFGTVFGNIAEFYNFVIYAFFHSYIAANFFPNKSHYFSLFLTFFVFLTGYITRPLGSLLFGYIGDKYSRKKALVISIALMTFTTFAIGLLPTYHSVGLLAPILLFLFRMLQGLSVSGEEGGAAVYLAEIFGKKKSGFTGALVLGSVYFGVLIACLTCFIIEKKPLARKYFIVCLAYPILIVFLYFCPFFTHAV